MSLFTESAYSCGARSLPYLHQVSHLQEKKRKKRIMFSRGGHVMWVLQKGCQNMTNFKHLKIMNFLWSELYPYVYVERLAKTKSILHLIQVIQVQVRRKKKILETQQLLKLSLHLTVIDVPIRIALITKFKLSEFITTIRVGGGV